MAKIILRVLPTNTSPTTGASETKELPLTNSEVDYNFLNINSELVTKAPIASPTFTGSVTIPGGTIDGTTIGGTTRAAGSFTTLTSNGATTFTSTTASTSTSTGAVVVSGGLGVAGNIYASAFYGSGANLTAIPAANLDTTVSIAKGGTNGTATPTAGGVAYGTGSQYAFTGAGTAGQLLSSNGAGAPVWINASPVASLSSDNTTATPLFPVFASGTGQFVNGFIDNVTTVFSYTPSTGTLAATAFSGSGAALTSLNATQLTSGVVPGARGATAGSADNTFVTYAGTSSTAGQFYGGTTFPSGTTRLNYAGNMFSTQFHSGANVLYGSTSGTVTLQPVAAAGTTTITLPATTGTVYVSGGTDVSLADGGTNASLSAVAGGIVYSGASSMAIGAAGTAGQVLTSGGAGVPTWTTLAASATTDTTNATNISGGTLPGARGASAGSTSSTFLTYSGTGAVAGQLNGGATVPTSTTRLNYEGNLYATNFFGNGANISSVNAASVSGLPVHSGTNNEANRLVRTDGSGYIQAGYIHSAAGNEGNNASPSRVWGTNGSDSYLRTYLTSALSVNYANSAGSASTATSASSATYATTAGTANGVAWTNVSGRPTAVSAFTNDSAYITSGGRAYPRRSDGTDLNFYWSGQSGQPTWLWGGNDGSNMYVYNPSNFSVNYANSAGSAGSVAWTNVSGRPTAVSSFSNDSGYQTSSGSVAYATSAGSAPANGGTSSAVTINYNNDSNATYQMLWGSGNGVYGTSGIYCNPSSDYLYSSAFQASNWFRSTGDTGWYSESWGGGIHMTDSTWVRVYSGKAFYVANTIASTGDIIAYYSDERLKTKLGNISGALDAVCSLNGFKYVNNETAKSFGYTKETVQLGVSAQEVEKVFPEIVTLAPFDMETNPETGVITSKSGENYKTVAYDKLVPVLIEAIKEQQQQINELKALVAKISKV